MWTAIGAAIASVISTIGNPVVDVMKDYFSYKKDKREAERQRELAMIQATTERIKSDNESRRDEVRARIDATTKSFKQYTFLYFFGLPLTISMVLPEYARYMWINFEAVPADFRYMFMIIYFSIWGIPIVSDYTKLAFMALGDAIQQRREYQLKKFDLKAFLRGMQSVFKDADMTDEQKDLTIQALTKGGMKIK